MLGRRSFVVWIFAGVLIWLVAPVAVQESFCTPQQPSTLPVYQDGASHEHHRSTYRFGESLISDEPNSDQTKDNSSADYPRQGVGALFCGTKVTDWALVFFTYSLVVVGWFTLRSNEQTVRDIERAYVSGGGIPEQDGFRLQINNYGKTPATLLELAVEFCEPDEIPTEPVYNRVPFRAMIQPGDSGTELMGFAYTNGPFFPKVVYGRFWYADIWDEPHSWGFIYQIAEGRVAPISQNVSRAYNLSN